MFFMTTTVVADRDTTRTSR